jgi:hypothetical protein
MAGYGEEDDVADRIAAGEDHGEAVDVDAFAGVAPG